jgi:multidrug efflux pump
MFSTSQNELAPTEDQSILFFQATGPQTATYEYNAAYSRQIVEAFESVPEYHESFFLLGFGGDTGVTFGGFKMQPPSQRERSQMEVQPEIQGKLHGIAGFQTAVFPRPSLPGSGGGLPVQLVRLALAGAAGVVTFVVVAPCLGIGDGALLLRARGQPPGEG